MDVTFVFRTRPFNDGQEVQREIAADRRSIVATGNSDLEFGLVATDNLINEGIDTHLAIGEAVCFFGIDVAGFASFDVQQQGAVLAFDLQHAI